MKLTKFYLIAFFLIILNFKNLYAIENKILFKIDNEIITTFDIFQEAKYLKVFNPQLKDLSDKELLEISKNSIIRDKIKKIEILKFVEVIKVENKFLLQLIKNKYNAIDLDSIESFENYLKINGLNINTIKEKLTIELIWNDLIFQKFNSKILIDKNKIKEEILKKPKKKERELSLSEIFFSVTKKSDFEKKYEAVIKDIELTGFKNAALIHSNSDTASIGGYIGWVKEDNLNKSIKEKISNLKVGQYSEAILTSSGFLIIKINDEKEYEAISNMDEKINELIKFKTNEQLNQFSRIYFNKIKNDLIFDDL
tara:strand:+ start:9820 stop:10752 length:933 start_codon:yes stop_codon:yes gene_type:complete